MRRRPKILAALAVVALPMALTGVSSGGPPPAVASVPSPGLAAAFQSAAQQYGVPESVLLAVSYAQTRWDDHGGASSTSGGYGPMHLTGVEPTALVERSAGQKLAKADSLRTLYTASDLTGLDPVALRKDPATNIAGGAALLASYQKSLGLPVGADTSPADWYGAIASYSGSPDQVGAATFADDVYAILAAGASRTTNTGQQVSMPAVKVSPLRDQLTRLKLKGGPARPAKSEAECPRSLACEWLPSPYQDLGNGDYGNHDKANRPETGKINYIIVHDTETSWQGTLRLVQDPTYVSWQYTMRSSDGQIWQHVKAKDVAWHAGNWYMNMHSIGIEHEGYAAQGATWYTEALYRNSARLVRYLAEKHDIPLDRAHIIGHDEIPGTLPTTVAGMHWDPGPYWDWERYFELLEAPIYGRSVFPVKAGSIVTIKPGFDDNVQVLTNCTGPGTTCTPQGTNFVYLRQAPDDAAPLVKDIGLRPNAPASTTQVSDIGARAGAGSRYVVAQRSGDWVAVWYLGDLAWFKSPASNPDAFAKPGLVVKPKPGKTTVPVYGRAYPEQAAYPAGIPYQPVTPLQYSIKAGQAYPVGDASIETDYYRATTFDGQPPTDHVQVLGNDRYYQIWFGHRLAYVRAADVDLRPAF
ncbi:N-acetylmuramyl-L-alanine amidase, negative regulator of AmpC, AmpD [Kribbella flavida DSM 17836]|uniref:N-acetylmuramoyl-L-alanine amidase n=1 Tax=Kribbella flavida (strain DSM 17836 / JCM 10339 / NBRC 14399) TaxID=479435 RepID=D2Q0D6_KRIFD|nr:N-acetylmuramoyl-L-alanine amidase [Kribbella flavida]ADB31928.1 N-acetylmuramyl-L-alanine amidase, negative regulator of AmpC, AmpD [Kribbella flavida DSM 17836]